MKCAGKASAPTRSLSARRAWIEICGGVSARPWVAWSLSARRAWIEIIDYIIDYATDAVALRKESVDRNSIALASFRAYIMVALRKESVDRNVRIMSVLSGLKVALRKESVDRNANFMLNA